MNIIITVIVVGVIALVLAEFISAFLAHRAVLDAKAPLYTKDGSPVMVDQAREERAAELRSIQVHAAVSPHARPVAAPGLASDRRTLIRAVTLGDKRRMN